MWKKPSTIHKIVHITTFYIGLAFLAYSITTAILLNNSHFYTLFALGTFFVLDYIDYKLNNASIITYFLNKRHMDAFLLFFIVATVGCFIVDFVLGVNIAKMWRWRDYEPIHFVIMFFFMNAAYILGMYELYRVISTLLRPILPNTHLIKLYFDHRILKLIAYAALLIGGLSFLMPLIPLLTGKDTFVEYLMLFPFVALILIADAINYLLKGKPVISNVIRLNPLFICSILLTSLTASLVTEVLNIYGREWEYVRMPFSSLKFLGIPAAVFIGWVPLVFSTVCMVTLAKHYSYSRHKH